MGIIARKHVRSFDLYADDTNLKVYVFNHAKPLNPEQAINFFKLCIVGVKAWMTIIKAFEAK